MGQFGIFCALVGLFSYFNTDSESFAREGRVPFPPEVTAFQTAAATAEYPEIRTKAEAQAFLMKYLPLATADNPRYRSTGSDDLTAWLIKNVTFGVDPATKGLSYTSDEVAIVFRNGAQVAENTHEVTFPLQDVEVSVLDYDSDFTEKGDKAVGILFKCASEGCVHSIWNGQASTAAQSDVYIQDSKLRAEIFKAFGILKKPPGDL